MVAIVFTCEGHYQAGHSEVPSLYSSPDDSCGEYWDDGFQFSYGGETIVPRGEEPRGKAWSCLSCGAETVYYGKYDSFACLKCDKFTEADHCKDGCDAGFEHQPAKPSLSKQRYETWSQVFGGR